VILSIETSTRAFSISLCEGHSEVSASLDIVHEIAHSQNIVSAVKFLLKSLNMSVSDILSVYAGVGPGSFTGIRIGLSFANTMLQTTGVPILGIPSLDLLAFEEGRWYNPVVPFIRSRKNEVYTASYDKGKRTSGFLALKNEEFRQFVAEKNPRYLIASEEDFKTFFPHTRGVKAQGVFSFPKSLLAISYVEECGLKPDRRYLKPLYVRDY
jgi:tRNA threonylcarbamoyladenosine biosynthesis protein TsaB